MEKRGVHWQMTSPQGYGCYDVVFFCGDTLAHAEGVLIEEVICIAALKALEAEAAITEGD